MRAAHPLFEAVVVRAIFGLPFSIREWPHVWVFDNDDLRTPFRKVAVVENGKLTFRARSLPAWLAPFRFVER